jgi:hypothetical protein
MEQRSFTHFPITARRFAVMLFAVAAVGSYRYWSRGIECTQCPLAKKKKKSA